MSAVPQAIVRERHFERRHLITVLSGLPSGGEISYEEVKALTGVDPRLDRSLVYSVVEHCRDVLGVVITTKAGVYYRPTDEELAGPITDRRRQRVYRQAQRGIGEAASVADFSGLDRQKQHQLLAKQAIFAATAIASHRQNADRLATETERKGLSQIDPEEVIAAARLVR